ncbi:MAG: extracellular solute-binding protein [Armatimonadetes bacterium]|nr:extracellular solute-binding protein [Armatimonadota bacterium]
MRFRLYLSVMLAVLAVSLQAGRQEGRRVKLVVWGIQSSEESKGLDAAVAEFERRNPDIDVEMFSMGAGGMNPQKLMTSIAGNVPPDVVNQDRFTIGDWAVRDAFLPLDRFLKRDRQSIRAGDFYPACWNETIYRGRVYAIPWSTDDRALYWNKTLFKNAGLDPERPPRTWDELLTVARKLTAYDAQRNFKTIGFIPNFGNSWLYLYSWQNGGEFMSRDGRTCTLNNPRSAQALKWMVSVYDSLEGAEKIGAFSLTFQANEMDPFLTDKVAMKIDGNWFLNNIARYGPHLDFGVAPAPVPADRFHGRPPFQGQPKFITWSGGFSYVIPRGARHVEEAWRFIQWMVSVDAARVLNRAQQAYNRSKGRPFVPSMSANIKVNEAVFREFAPSDSKFRKPLRLFIDLMDVSRYRPVTFVGQRLWDEHVRAFDLAIHHKLSPEEALQRGQEVVRKEIDKVLVERYRYPLLNWKYPYLIVAALALAGAGFVWRKARQAGPVARLLRGEAFAGYLFASPWIVGFLVFTIGPIIASIIFSFCDYNVLHPARYLGLKNYAELLKIDSIRFHFLEGLKEARHIGHWLQPSRYIDITYSASDPLAWKSVYNALYLSLIGIPLGMAVSLGIAMLLNTKVRGMTWYRTVYYLPSITPVVAAALLWPWILNPDNGLLNGVWRSTVGNWFGWPAPPWLAGEAWSKPSLILMGLWGAGGGMILWLAGLQGIPQHLYEAADIDGANVWQKFRHVTIPQLTPYIFFNLIMGTIGSLRRFTDVYIMTAGGPVDSTQMPVLYLFNNAFQYFKMGYASAWAWILFIIVLIPALIQLNLAPRWVHYEGEKR